MAKHITLVVYVHFFPYFNVAISICISLTWSHLRALSYFYIDLIISFQMLHHTRILSTLLNEIKCNLLCDHTF